MEVDQIEIVRIHTRITHQWEILTRMVMILWTVIVLLGAVLVVAGYRISRLSSEIEQLKSRQMPRLTQFAPVEQKPSPVLRSAGDGQSEAQTAGN